MDQANAPLGLPLEDLAPAFVGRPHLAALWAQAQRDPAALTPPEQIQLALAECRVLGLRGQHSELLARLQVVRAWAGQAADREGEAGALGHMAWLHNQWGHPAQAAALATEAAQLAGRSPAGAQALLMHGNAIAYSGLVAEAEADFLLAADISREVGYTLGRIQAVEFLAHVVYSARGQINLALASWQEALRLRGDLGLPQIDGRLFRANLAFVRAERALTRSALAELAAVAPPGSVSAGLHAYLSALACAADDEDLLQARQWLAQARALAEATGNPQLGVLVSIAASVCDRLAGQPAAALAWAQQAVEHAQRTDQHYHQTYALMERAHARWEAGDPATAEDDVRTALALADQGRDAYGAARAAFMLAALHQAQAHPTAEAAWLEAAQRMRLGDLVFILERERAVSYPLLAAHARSRNAAVRASAESLLGQLAELAPPPLQIKGLGRFEVWQGRRQLPDRAWARRKAGEVFRFLLLQPNHAAAREAVLEALWPEQDAAAAHTQLHQATSALRRLLEPDLPDKFPSRYLEVGAQRLALRLPPGSTLDFVDFELALAHTRASHPAGAAAHQAALHAALDRYTGPLFMGDLYADWAALARERLAGLHLAGLLALAQAGLNAAQPAAALEAARRALAADPWREDAALLGMRAYVAQDDRPGALRLYAALERRLRADLDLAPRADLQALAAALRAP